MQFSLQIYLMYLLLCLSGCDATPSAKEEGIASYYADFFHGKPTASGAPYDSASFSAAHRNLPFGTKVRITNLSNQKQVTLRINDRGPYVDKRIIDVSKAAAKELDFITEGITDVSIEILEVQQ